MFHNLWLKIKGVLIKMGLINAVQNVLSTSDLIIDSNFYSKISEWQNIYAGEDDIKSWQDVTGKIHRRKRMSLKMAKVISKKMSTLVFNEKARILISENGDAENDDNIDKSQANQFVKSVLEDNYFYHNFGTRLEYMFSGGGLAIRTYVKDGKVKIRFATADSFLPISQDENGVSECAIISKFAKSGKYYTLVELHTEDDSNYLVQNRLFESDNNSDELGTEIPLTTIYGDSLKEISKYPKSSYSRPTFVYLKPNLANNFDPSSPLGISIYANAVDTLDELDQAYDMLMQELVMGRRRIVAPDWMMIRNTDPRTGKKKAYVDFEEEVYQSYYSDISSPNAPQKPEDVTLGLRTQEITQTINTLLDYLCGQTGFSVGSFTYTAAQGVETATGVISRNSDTYQSKRDHETIIEDGLKKMIISILELGKAAGIYQGSTDVDISINFDDSIAQDRTENAKYFQLMNGNAPLMPQKEAIKRANDLTDSEAEDWYSQIKEENSQGDMADILDDNKDGDQDETPTMGN